MNAHPETIFFKEQLGKNLPTPAEVRAIAATSRDHYPPEVYRPRPVKFPSLGVLVKYGSGVTVTEAHTQMFVRDRLDGQVPVPEVFGWTEDSGQVFIYMSLIKGDTLEERWANMNEVERQAVCTELRQMAQAWRTLKSGERENYIGSINGQPLNEIFLFPHPELSGPFQGPSAVDEFQRGCGIDIAANTGIAFTHNDLIGPNILLTQGSNPKVVAIIDWAQSGWYPAYWEYCKAREVDLLPENFSFELQEEWREKYLPMVLDPVDNETCYYPFRWFVLSKGL